MAKKSELHDGEQWVDVTESVASPATVFRGAAAEAGVSLRHLSAADALTQLRGAREGGFVALVDAPVGRPVDQVVVDDHAYSGEQVGSAWHFAPGALEMACRVAGWSTVEWLSTEPAKLRLS
jgi:hypothetical protein